MSLRMIKKEHRYDVLSFTPSNVIKNYRELYAREFHGDVLSVPDAVIALLCDDAPVGSTSAERDLFILDTLKEIQGVWPS